MKTSEGSIPDRVKKGTAPVLERLNALDKDQLHAVLATESDGQPYTSMIAFALSTDKKGFIFVTPKETLDHESKRVCSECFDYLRVEQVFFKIVAAS